SMIPILVLGVFMVGLVLSTEQATRHVVGQLTQQFPVYQRQISRVLVRIVEVRAASGLLGTAVLVVFSTPLFGASRLVLHRLLGEAAKQLFRLYVQEFGVYDEIYGPLGVLAAFVMFVYYSAVVFVFAAAFVAALDARRQH